MKTLTKAALLVALSPVAALSVAQAQVAPSVGVVNLDEVMAKSNAFVLAENQIKITYKANIDQATTINQSLQGLLATLDTNKDRQVSDPELAAATPAVRGQVDAKQRELATAAQPIQRARAYVQEQIYAKFETAVTNAMSKKRIAVVLPPQAVLKAIPAAELTNDVIAEVNTLVPSAQIVPPANWGQAPAAGAAPAAPKPQPQGR